MLIRTTLELIRKRLNDFFEKIDPMAEDWVVLSNIADDEGHVWENTKNKIVMSLVNIQAVSVIDNRDTTVAQPTHMHLFVVFFANFKNLNYTQGLAMISRTLSFFQQNPRFSRENLPGLDPVVDKLTFEFTNLDMADLNRLMRIMGTTYLPLICYKVRMLPFAAPGPQAETPST